MSIISKFKSVVGISEIDEEDDIEEASGSDKSVSIIPTEKTSEQLKALGTGKSQSAAAPSGTSKASVSGDRFTKQSGVVKMVVIEPQGFDESPKLVDSLKAKKPIIINLENLETDVARKIFDFLSGATYALNGNVQKIANNIFLFAPENVDIAHNMNLKAAEQTVKSPWK